MGAGLTAAAVAQQPVKLGVLNDQTGLYADLTGMGSVHAANENGRPVVGEIYRVDDEVLERLDRLEGVLKGMYSRELIDVTVPLANGERLPSKAFIYVAGPDGWQEHFDRLPPYSPHNEHWRTGLETGTTAGTCNSMMTAAQRPEGQRTSDKPAAHLAVGMGRKQPGRPAHTFTQGPGPFPRAPGKRTSGQMARFTVFQKKKPGPNPTGLPFCAAV